MIEFRLLGSVDLRGSERRALRSVLAQPKRVALLAYLAVARPNGFHRRDKLLGLFWPESDQERGRGALRKALYLLRQSLGEDVIVSRGDEEIGLAEDALWCDAVAFETLLEKGEPREALELYRGDLLEGFFIADSPEFERWLESERARLRRRAAEAAWTLVDEAEAVGNGVEAARWARKAVSLSPNDEAAFRRLLELLDRLGDRTGAMEEYEAFARRSKEEYEAEPSPETQALIAAIREREGVGAGDGNAPSVGSPARLARGPAPESAPVTQPSEPQTEPHPVSLLRVLATYAVVSLGVLVAVHMFTLQLGLPDWFFPSAVVVLLVCLPIIVSTALVQRAAISARRTGAEARAPWAAARRWLTWRNAVGVTAVALAVLGLAVGGYMAMRVMGVGPWGTLIARGVLEERDVIVLADFEDHTGDSILALTVTDLVRVDLDQSPVLRVADDDHVGRVLQRMERDRAERLTYELAREVAIREGLKAVVSGAINLAGSSYALTVRLVAAESGEVLFSDREVAANPDAIVDATDRLSGRLRERIGESLKSVQGSPPLSQARTASLDAARLLTQAGLANLRGDYSLVVELSSRAIEIDTAFGAAYLARAIGLSNLRIDWAQRIADFTRAYELRQNVPLADRYMREGWYHGAVTNNLEKGIEAFRLVLEFTPDRPAALHNLGMSYMRLRDYGRAEDMFRRRLELNSLAGVSWGGLARVLFNQGKFDEAWETLRRWEATLPDHPSIPLYPAQFSSARGDYDAAEAYLRTWQDLHIGNFLYQARIDRYMARLAQVQGRLAEAESYLRDAMAVHEERGRIPGGYLGTGRELAGLRSWFLGDTAGALETVNAALERHPLDSLEPIARPYAELAGFYAFAGKPERARELLLEWETVVPPDLRQMEEVARHRAWGAVALAEGRAESALAEFRFVDERSPCPICALPLLGRAHELAGQPDSALAIYERYLTTPHYGRVVYSVSASNGLDSYWLPVVYERLGDLYEQLGDTAKAIHYYGKLVDLWKDADPELQPRVEAARRAMEALSPDI